MFTNEPILIVDGSQERLQVVLGQAGEFILQTSRPTLGRGMEFLAPTIDWAMKTSGLDFSHLGGLACVNGPGSFTGLRMTLATLNGLGLCMNLPMAGLSALELIAANLTGIVSGLVVSFIRSRTERAYVQAFFLPETTPSPAQNSFTEEKQEIFPLTGAAEVSLEEIPGHIRTLTNSLYIPSVIQRELGKVYLVGSGARPYLKALCRNWPQAVPVPERFDFPQPEILLHNALGADYSYEPLQADYIRASDAEENLPGLALRRGLSPEEAVRKLTQLSER